jgi:hypothetical protein
LKACIDNRAIVLYRRGNVKGWLLTTVRFRNAAPFVTGANTLVWSELFDASASQLKSAVTRSYAQRRPTVALLLSL